MNPYGIIYEYDVSGAVGTHCVLPQASPGFATHNTQLTTHNQYGNSRTRIFGIGLLMLAIGGATGPFIPQLRLESEYAISQVKDRYIAKVEPKPALPKAVPVIFDPLMTPDGASIDPISEEFAIIVPKVGINAKVIENVDPGKSSEYYEALEQGVAHANTSFLPGQDGTVYLFSHSTNYDWFVKDLNAVFYHLKNLDKGDTVILVYKGSRYTYQITGKQVVSPRDISYLVPNYGKKSLILQTCWPPGSIAQRLLIFADLVKEQSKQI